METVGALLDQLEDAGRDTRLVGRLPDGRYAHIAVVTGQRDGVPVVELHLQEHER